MEGVLSPPERIDQIAMQDSKKAICILGMHRSGTSAVTRAVNLLGPYIGREDHMMRPVAGDNPHGFWELLPIYSFHERLLSFLSRSWDCPLPLRDEWWKEPQIAPFRDELKSLILEEFGDRNIWLWKDPRTALLLPLWQQVMRELDIEVNYLICLRNPLDVAASLKRRNDFSKGKSLSLWLLYNISALFWTMGARRMLLNFDALLEDWEGSLRKVSASFSIPWPEDEEGLRGAVVDFLKPNARHTRSDSASVASDSEVAGPVARLYHLLFEAAERDALLESKSFSDEVSSLYDDYLAYAGIFVPDGNGRLSEDPAPACPSPDAGDESYEAGLDLPETGEVPRLVFPSFPDTRASIIIPVWNHWDYTCRCLKAIVAGTHDIPYEVIVVDNGSTDKTAELLTKAENIVIVRNQSNFGYLLACNQGAAAAKGEHLVFLNNDTEPLSGWLRELVSAADADPRAGAVGGKLIYPDGRLQEAGGMIFSDGHSWNFGTGDNPDEEIYNLTCEVDYCSGACLLVKRSVFEVLGGFDARYAPAYYEDADLCFGLRKMRYKVLYNPHVCVVHHESVTAGKAEASGFRTKYMAINRTQFSKKWADELLRQDASPWQGKVPITSSRERLEREGMTQDDLIYRFIDGKEGLRPCLNIDKSVLYRSTREKEDKSQEVILRAIRSYGTQDVAIAWTGGNDSAMLLYLIRQAFDGQIPVKVISFLPAHYSSQGCRFLEGLCSDWGFDMSILDTKEALPLAGVSNWHGSQPETLLRSAVKSFGLRAVITAGREDMRGTGSPPVYFSHEDAPRFVRVQPMLHFREVDVWHYIKAHDLPFCEIVHGRDCNLFPKCSK